jgi:hypothetical protein
LQISISECFAKNGANHFSSFSRNQVASLGIAAMTLINHEWQNQTRNPNFEIRNKSQNLNFEISKKQTSNLGHSGLFRHSTFVLRHFDGAKRRRYSPINSRTYFTGGLP